MAYFLYLISAINYMHYVWNSYLSNILRIKRIKNVIVNKISLKKLRFSPFILSMNHVCIITICSTNKFFSF